MQKVITVRGSANVKVKPDYVNILVNLETLNVECGSMNWQKRGLHHVKRNKLQ